MTTRILRPSVDVVKSSQREFSDALASEVLRVSTIDRKLVATRLGVSRSVVDKQIENERRHWMAFGCIWIAANKESGSPDWAAPATYLSDFAADLNARSRGGHSGEREDLMAGGGDFMAAAAGLLEELSTALRDNRISDSERQRIERSLRKIEERCGEIRRESAASNDRWHEEHDAKPTGPTPIRGSRHRAEKRA